MLDLRTHRLSLEDGPGAYEAFQKTQDGAIKVVLDPTIPANAGTALAARPGGQAFRDIRGGRRPPALGPAAGALDERRGQRRR